MKKGWLPIVEQRRHIIMSARIRHFSVRRIHKELPGLGEINPSTQKPWGYETVVFDVQWVDRQIREALVAEPIAAKAKVLAQIREVQRMAWGSKDYGLLLRALEDERELLGLDVPARVDVTHRFEELARELGMDEREAREAIAEVERHLKKAR